MSNENKDRIERLELEDKIDEIEHNKKLRKLELKKKRKKESSSLLWVWEFSKKVVLICVALYVVEQCYGMYVMWTTNDFGSLSTMISECSEVLRAGVFGYFIKAGVENAVNIATHNRENN